MRDLSQTKQPSKKSKATAFAINLGLASIIIVLGLVYIFSVNTMATQSFKTKKLSTELADLESQHKKLELQNSALQSVSTLQQESHQLNFVPATNITYLKDDSFALK